MRVILLRDVAKIGRRFDIVEVPDGYAMNKLVPQGAAKPATPENVKQVRAQKDMAVKIGLGESAHFDEVVTVLQVTSVTVTASANTEGGLFEALKPVKIAEALTKAIGMPVPESYIALASPIKHTGSYTVPLKSHSKQGQCTVVVVAR
jgi:large subunit ribosomal protein L9